MNKTGNHNLKKQEINIYREIQRNTEMAMKALDAVTDKIYDDRLAAVVAEQELQYSGYMTGQCRIWWRARPRPTGRMPWRT